MSSIHSGGVGTPGVPGPEAEIRRLRRRVVELEATCARVHERNQALEAEASVASELRIAMQRQIATLTAERDEARATSATEAKRAEHFATEAADAIRERDEARRQKGGKR